MESGSLAREPGLVGLTNLVRAYRMYRQMMKYPHLLDEIRDIFAEALSERGIASPEAIRKQALEQLRMERSSLPDERALSEHISSLTDLLFATHFSCEEIDSYINLARKEDAFRNLNKVVNTEGATSHKIRQALKEFCDIPQGNIPISPDEAEGVRVALISHFISSQLPFVGVAKRYITIRDVDEMVRHSMWNRRRAGKFGGKAAGMFLANKIILPRLEERDPELERYIALPESYYFNSGILSDFIDYNHLYSFHTQKYKSRELLEEGYAHMGAVLEKTSFPPDVMEDFRKFLARIGEWPLILRSSSLLEDSFGYSFSGKYDSVFIPNLGDVEVRLKQLTHGLKLVLKSIFNPSAITYRRDHNLLDFDERMSVLVQKVVGRRFGSYFFPFAAGVAFSQNAYAWTPRIVKEEGMVRMVLGLGTRAVDRIAQDYPRLIALSHPTLRPEVGSDQIRKYSQKIVDVLNLESGELESLSYLDLFGTIEYPDVHQAVSVDEEGYLSPPLFASKKVSLARSCITFDNLLTGSPFIRLMKKVLTRLEKAYGCPIEVEFAWDMERLYILQCRSLAVMDRVGRVAIPTNIPRDAILFTNCRTVSNSIVKDIEIIVYVNPKAYALITSYERRMAVARAVGHINRLLEGRRYALLGPSRWGTNDIRFGVKVGYGDINRTLILGEVAFEARGMTPEASFGTHFFNDLVEARILPLAIYPDEPDVAFREDFLLQSPNMLPSLAPSLADLAPVIHIIHVPSCTEGRFLHVYQDGIGQKGIGFFARSDESNSEESTS